MRKKFLSSLARLLAIGLILVGWGCSGDANDDGLSGTWLAVSVESDGESVPNAAVKRLRFRFEGKKLFVRGNFENDRDEECSFSTDSTKYPKHLDFTPPNEGKPILAIYERNGATLRVCLRHGNSDKGRPAEFKTTSGSDLVLVVFRLGEEGNGGGQSLSADAGDSTVESGR